mmetsp:Transcript_90350/g.254758  ORF Transcript_90350/g.254758 Transcript_90350/m.254758 type:complete len:94 (+) Transcript_90350:192-473(+)
MLGLTTGCAAHFCGDSCSFLGIRSLARQVFVYAAASHRRAVIVDLASKGLEFLWAISLKDAKPLRYWSRTRTHETNFVTHFHGRYSLVAVLLD